MIFADFYFLSFRNYLAGMSLPLNLKAHWAVSPFDRVFNLFAPLMHYL